ncbi:adenine deaminase C-terminal domain-containing protein [Neorhizobium sp. JUb45]|uniref:adenine deaminase n=1 Tax=unclassified Neorhizobium TaxID=2629175 RepID=UPI0010D238E4|nr:adenine deaminase C-terminal domain-containing protein [Neorhizobium sp. JUb45]TCR06178.1 adenine deaminase [Neorhizobium sp. JUb45]
MNDIIINVHKFTDPDLRSRAIAAARGDAPFDILITGGTLVDVMTEERRLADIGLVGPIIASVHAPGHRSDAAEIIDAKGAFITPGLIDMHMHIESSMVTPATYAASVMPRGVTSIVWDPHEFGNVHGIDGVRWAVEAIKALPLRSVVLAPSSVPSAPGYETAGADFDAGVIEELLLWPKIGGLAEVMNMRDVINREPRMAAIMQVALTSEKLVCGHARGLTGGDLAAFMIAGVTSDHELTSAADLMEKLRAGLTIELRGSHDHLLPEFVASLNTLGHLPSSVTLCTDDVFPDDLLKAGGLDDVVRRLVRYGLKPEWALKAATINAANRLERADLGLIAAGRRADIVIFEDLTDFRARHVFASGTQVARDGAMTVATPMVDTGPLTDSVKLSNLTENDFRVASNGSRVKLAVIDRPRFTQWAEAEADVVDGYVVPPAGTTMIAVTHRHGVAETSTKVGFLGSWGNWRGAFATTVAHDSHNLTVFGGNAADMAVAANAVIEAGGGLAVAAEGKVIAILPLPLSGLVSDAPLGDVAEGFAAVRSAMDTIVEWQPPYLIFKACFGATLACNAGPHQTDRGVADVITGKLLETPVIETLR